MLDGKSPSYYLDYNNLTNTPVIPTKISQLTNDSGFTKITGYSGSGDIKVYKRYSQKGYTGGTSTYWFYKIATLPVYRSSDNYASLIIRGRIGGWEINNMSIVNALVFSRGEEGIVAMDLSKEPSGYTYNACDIVCYREVDGTTSVYLKCAYYFIFDITIESYREDVILPTSVSYVTSVTGTEKTRLSTTRFKLNIYQGNAYVGGTRLVKSNESLKNPKSLTFGSKSYDGSSDITLTADDLGAITSHQDISGKLDKSGGTMKGSLTIEQGNAINVSQYNDASGVSLMNNGDGTVTQFGSSSRPARMFSSVQPEWYKNGASQGVLAIKGDIPTKTSQLTNDSGYTTNKGTVTSVAVKMNGATKGTVTSSGTIDLGTVITSHQDISGKLDKVTTKDTYQLYGKNANGEQQMLEYSLGNVGWSIVQRDANGCVNVATPTDSYHATTKQYVDERSGVTGVKGNSETSYRTGDVNITKSNIGLSKVRNVSSYSKTETDNLLAQKIDKSNFNTPVIVSNGTTSIQLPSKGIYMFLYYSFKTGNTHIVFVTYNGIVNNTQYVSSGYSLICSTSGVVTDSASSQMHARVFKISDYGWGD